MRSNCCCQSFSDAIRTNNFSLAQMFVPESLGGINEGTGLQFDASCCNALTQRDDNNKGNTLLHSTILNKDSDATTLLLKLGADVDAKNHEGKSALHLLIESQNYDELIKLLEKSQDPTGIDNEGLTILHKLITSFPEDTLDRITREEAITCLAMMLDKGLDIFSNQKETTNTSPLVLALANTSPLVLAQAREKTNPSVFFFLFSLHNSPMIRRFLSTQESSQTLEKTALIELLRSWVLNPPEELPSFSITNNPFGLYEGELEDLRSKWHHYRQGKDDTENDDKQNDDKQLVTLDIAGIAEAQTKDQLLQCLKIIPQLSIKRPQDILFSGIIPSSVQSTARMKGYIRQLFACLIFAAYLTGFITGSATIPSDGGRNAGWEAFFIIGMIIAMLCCVVLVAYTFSIHDKRSQFLNDIMLKSLIDNGSESTDNPGTSLARLEVNQIIGYLEAIIQRLDPENERTGILQEQIDQLKSVELTLLQFKTALDEIRPILEAINPENGFVFDADEISDDEISIDIEFDAGGDDNTDYAEEVPKREHSANLSLHLDKDPEAHAANLFAASDETDTGAKPPSELSPLLGDRDAKPS